MRRSFRGAIPLAAMYAAWIALASLLAGPSVAQVQAGPRPQVHLGVKICSGTPCHGNRGEPGASVLQNEYVTWSTRDRHARAYAVLLEERSQRIARNLGLEAAAHESPRCLSCHSDFVPDELRGKQFSLEDGVGCEACHGGSVDWLGPHQAAGDHGDNLARGMFPTDDPASRAELCVSCHFGTPEKFVDHRMLSAGHPRMSFELDTFTQIQPAHFEVDDDYGRRGKQTPEAARLWAVGQAVIARETLDALLDPMRGRDGIWPEFALFDCHACHHPMSDTRWAPRPSLGAANRTGIARFNDPSLVMLRHALAGLDPAEARRLGEETEALHVALARGIGSPERAAARLRDLVQSLIPRLAAWDVGAEDARAIARSLVADGLDGDLRDYAGAEQGAMALQSLASTLQAAGALQETRLAEIDRGLQALVGATEDDEAFRPASLTPLLRDLERHLR